MEPGPPSGQFPCDGTGRHFIARGLQRSAESVSQAVGYLRGHRSAGGFAYTIGDPEGRIVSAESGAGQCEWREAGQIGPLTWHTNHGRYITGADATPGGTSIQRGDVLGTLKPPAREPDMAWFVRILAGAPPAGARADPSRARQAATLCTFVASLADGEAYVLPRGCEAVSIPLADLAQGMPGRQRRVPAPASWTHDSLRLPGCAGASP